MTNMQKYAYDTVTEAVNDLFARGYKINFMIGDNGDCLIAPEVNACYFPGDFEIDEYYRFDGMTDPGDDMVVYAISNAQFEHKGVVVNGYGAYSSARTAEMVKKFSMEE